MSSIPSDGRLESSWALARDPYRFISRTCDRLGVDVFTTRLLLRRTICMRGADAARVFYDPAKFTQRHAAPRRMQQTLFGRDGVQSLDGDAHRARKAIFMRLLSPAPLERLLRISREEWEATIARWSGTPAGGDASATTHCLLSDTQQLLCRAVCRWAGVPLDASDVARRTADFAALIEAPAALGTRYIRGRVARRRSNAWAQALIAEVRRGELTPAPGTALHEFATCRDARGRRLPSRIAAVELLNVLRPTVAVAVYVVHVAIALHDHPECRKRLQAGDPDYRLAFVQEVRRCAPFSPFTAARVRRTFQWHGYQFARGTRVLLDLWGTGHEASHWPEPHRFDPARFEGHAPDTFELIPQGGGDPLANHRCAGEWITIALMEQATDVLTRWIDYEVPAQSVRPDLARPPAMPPTGFLMANVRTRTRAPLTGSRGPAISRSWSMQ